MTQESPVGARRASPDEGDLKDKLREAGERLQVPGVAAGVYHEGEEHHAFFGSTSVENPLAVDEGTLFQFGSTCKTFTATAIMRLVDQGRVDLHERVRRYVPELRLKDQEVASEVRVLHLLNHTAGWAGDLFVNTGDGDDALAKYVERMADLEQVTGLGTAMSYNNASLALAGRVIEKVVGKPYEQAMKELIFEPLGLEHCFFFTNDVMTRRFACGHQQHADGTITVSRPWAGPRGEAPAGSTISSTVGDQLKWARFHLGDGRGADGTPVLSRDSLDLMKRPTFDMRGGALGDYVGISWLMRDVDGVRLVGHGGTTTGQHSAFQMVPARDFAIAVLTNCGPNGAELHNEIVRWALEAYAGVVDSDPKPVELEEAELAKYAGTYETIAVTCRVSVKGGGLELETEIKPETLAQLREAGEEGAGDRQVIPLGMLPGPGDRYVVTHGPAKGLKGYFVRSASGEIEAIHAGGRLATRVRT